jgi:hypothetical protein
MSTARRSSSLLDGEPILKPIENSSPDGGGQYPLSHGFHKADKSYYLMGNDTWYRATAVTDKWEEIADPPQAVMQVRPETPDTEDPSEIGSDLRIIGATEPSELISTDGPPRLTPFPGNDLMFVENTTSEILYEVDTGRYFLLISGRWYQAKQMTGPWSHVLPERLPESFCRDSTGLGESGAARQRSRHRRGQGGRTRCPGAGNRDHQAGRKRP